MIPRPSVISSRELSAAEAKWITLKQIKYVDADGTERFWECAERKTRKSSGVDAVAVLAILRSKTNAFPLSTVVIEQYRPPIDKFIIELPAAMGKGLVDEKETPEQAAIRELEEETGFTADKVLQVSSTTVSDPGMTNANMKLVVLDVLLADQMETPTQKLESGEFIVQKVVELAKLNECLQGNIRQFMQADYAQRGFVVDARLSHFATGYDMALQLNQTIYT
ncbi:NUDIX hydrolase domain-like protein [Collybia nuda]|uniref:NUDIX hydrolase domain-like protein n=1 Tax=Collybia nuda TaxID=64659 RepID=A0A9P5XT28_9AGAR|nr:NUDIX hydrolase domain-like protein [Collybia nuda]